MTGKTPAGFDFEIDDNWHEVQGTLRKLCRISFEGAEIASTPGIITKKDWNNGHPDPEMLVQLYRNMINSAEWVAMERLGWTHEQIKQALNR